MLFLLTSADFSSVDNVLFVSFNMPALLEFNILPQDEPDELLTDLRFGCSGKRDTLPAESKELVSFFFDRDGVKTASKTFALDGTARNTLCIIS